MKKPVDSSLARQLAEHKYRVALALAKMHIAKERLRLAAQDAMRRLERR